MSNQIDPNLVHTHDDNCELCDELDNISDEIFNLLKERAIPEHAVEALAYTAAKIILSCSPETAWDSNVLDFIEDLRAILNKNREDTTAKDEDEHAKEAEHRKTKLH